MLRAFYRVVAVGTISLLGLLLVELNFRRFPDKSLLHDARNMVEPRLAAFCPDWRFPRNWHHHAVVRNDVGLCVLRKMRVWSKVLWMLLLIPSSGLGALIYYFCVYRGRPSVISMAQDTQMTA